MKLKKALLIVDVQNDFCPQGALPVKEGDRIIPVINEYIELFSENKLPIFLSRDWHPKKSKHFKQFGGEWMKHCIQDTQGAMFHPTLKFPKEAIVLSKGMDAEKNSYSAFQAIDSLGTEFINLLRIFGVEELFVCGLATDYCVKYSTLDALKFGFKVKLLIDAIKGVDIKLGDSQAAIEEMLNHGAKEINFEQASNLLVKNEKTKF